MKMKQLVDAVPSMQKIAGQDLHTGTLYRISRLLGKAEPHLKFYDERRAAILEECGAWENGKYVPKPDMVETLETKMQELLGLDLDMEGIKPVKIPAYEDVRISYADLRLLEGLIKIEFEEDEEE